MLSTLHMLLPDEGSPLPLGGVQTRASPSQVPAVARWLTPCMGAASPKSCLPPGELLAGLSGSRPLNRAHSSVVLTHPNGQNAALKVSQVGEENWGCPCLPQDVFAFLLYL